MPSSIPVQRRRGSRGPAGSRQIATARPLSPYAFHHRHGARRRSAAAFIVVVGGAILGYAAVAPVAAAPALIREIQVSKTSVCSDEALKVTVVPSASDVEVVVNGEAANPRYVQFARPGMRAVTVVASKGGEMQTASREIRVVRCPARRTLRLFVQPNPFRVLTVDFTVANARELKLVNRTFHWDFGDGARQTTTVPFVSHTYAAFVDQTKPRTAAHVTLRVSGEPAEVWKTIVIANPSALTRQRGYVQALATTSRRLRRQHEGGLVGEFAISNLETSRITFTGAQEEQLFCDPAKGSRLVATSLATIVDGVIARQSISGTALTANMGRNAELGGRQSMKGRLTFQQSRFPSDVCGVTFRLSGRTGQGLRAYASLHFQVRPNPTLTRSVKDPRMRGFLADLVKRGLAPPSRIVSHEDLYRLEREGRISRTSTGWEVLR